jgi:predicted O-linked N-acetylglucosamine transferase (SPINDLY family)
MSMTSPPISQPSAQQQLHLATQWHRQGQIERAAEAYRAVLALEPRHVQALQMLGIAELQLGHTDRAVQVLRVTVELLSQDANALANLGGALEVQGELDEALSCYDQALALQPDHVNAWSNRGGVLLLLKRADEALASAEKAIALQPAQASAWIHKGGALLALGQPEEALAAGDQALGAQPNHPRAWMTRGMALGQLHQWPQALAALDRALGLHAGLAEAWLHRGHALRALGREDEGLNQYNQALAVAIDQITAGNAAARPHLNDMLAAHDALLAAQPDDASAWHNHGHAMLALQRYTEAVTCYERSLALDPGKANAWCSQANALSELSRLDEALACYERALTLDSDPLFHYNRGIILLKLRRPAEAVSSLDRALAAEPLKELPRLARAAALGELRRVDAALADYDRLLAANPLNAEAWRNLGQLRLDTDRREHALNTLNRALQYLPRNAELWTRHGSVLLAQGQREDALASFQRALALDPAQRKASWLAMICMQNIGQWHGIQTCWQQELDLIRATGSLTYEFFMLSHPLISARDLADALRTKTASEFGAVTPAPLARHATPQRLRVAYLSADFRDHAMAYLMAGVFEQHDRQRFEITAVTFRPIPATPMGDRLRHAFDHVIDAQGVADEQVVQRLREMNIDIAVDLMGYTDGSRYVIFAHRCAPIQVTYLGYPGTSGAPFIDYIIGDRWVTPLDQADTFSEKIVLMPESFQANDDKRKIASEVPSRASLGLPESSFVFCCLNNTYKITPMLFDIWMRLLTRVPGSVLWLVGETETVVRNLRAEAQSRGVDPARLVFAKHVPYAQYLAQYRQADLFFDTLPFNAGTTASDALWAGLPVLTQLGQTFAGRMAASLLDAVGLPELITRSDDEYEQLALKLATEPTLLKSYRDRLAANLSTTPLFDTQRFTRHLETAYQMMWQRYEQGLPPDHITVPALATASTVNA